MKSFSDDDAWGPGAPTPKDAAGLAKTDKQLLDSLKASLAAITSAPLTKDTPLHVLKGPNYVILTTTVTQFVQSPAYRLLKNMLVGADLDFSAEDNKTIAAIAAFRQALKACEVWVSKEKVKTSDLGAATPLLSESVDEDKLEQSLARFRKLSEVQVAALLADVKILLAKVGAPPSPSLLSRVEAREKYLLGYFYRFYADHKSDDLNTVSQLDKLLDSPLYKELDALLYEEKPDHQGKKMTKEVDFVKENPGVQEAVAHLLVSFAEVEKLRQDKLVKLAYPALRQESYQPPTPR